MEAGSAAPRPVRVAGLLMGAQGLVGAAATAAALLRALIGTAGLSVALTTAAWFAACSAAVFWVAAGLFRGRVWARNPAVVGQLLLLGVAWYAASASSQLEYGVPAAFLSVLILVLLFSGPAARWVYEGDDADRSGGSR